jgi:hypothetical protein
MNTCARTKFIPFALCAVAFFGWAGPVRASGQYLKVDYPASTNAGELQTAVTYTLWIPDGVKILRGIIVHQHGAGTTASIEGSTAADDLHWQALAQKWLEAPAQCVSVKRQQSYPPNPAKPRA